MATIDTDPGTRLGLGTVPAVADRPAGPAAWPTVDLAARRSSVATQLPPGPGEILGRTPEEPEAMSQPAAGTVARSADPRLPSKLLADLTTAMRATAVASRDQALAQVEHDAAAAVEAFRATSVGTAKALRLQAEADVEAIRDWAKAEAARIRSESESRTAERRAELEAQLAAEAAAVEQHVFDVHDALARYQAEMAAFFERLVAETDPARLATMAETMPEPPAITAPADAYASVRFDDAEEPALEPAIDAAATAGVVDAGAGPAESAADGRGPVEAGPASADPDAERETHRVQEPARTATVTAEPEPDEAEAVLDEVQAAAVRDEVEVEAALAEVEVVPAEGVVEPDPAEPAAREDGRSFADRLASFLPRRAEDAAEGEPQTTQVIVTGLASVASIASFKRQIGRIAGVSSVAVSSGPDGEFVFNAIHRPTTRLADAIPGLQGFDATVTRTGDGVVFVAAHDPDTEG